MAASCRKIADDALAVAMASGQTLKDAAIAAGVAERTAARRWADTAFRCRVNELRGEMVGRALGVMAANMADGADGLRKLLKAKSEGVRLSACRALLELTVKVREAVELESRVAALESRQANTGG